MALDRLRYCIYMRRVVADDEFHAGAFHSDRCEGCIVIEDWMESMVRADIDARAERATYHLSLLDS